MENNEFNSGSFDSQEDFRSSQPVEPLSPIQTKPKKRPVFRAAVSVVLVLALVAGGCALTYSVINSQWQKKAQMDAQAISQMQKKLDSLQVTPTENLSYSDEAGMMSPKMVYQSNARSVVGISAAVQTVSYAGQTRQGTSTGSGFIITENGYVVTNYHVIEGATSVTVVIDNDEEYEAEVVGFDALNDVAVLKIDGKDLPAVTLGSSDELSIGDMVVAIGNPLGSLTATLTVGYVSGKDRQVSTDSKTVINMIQTDAAINSGNSGGPLFNMKGEVVGITTAKFSGTSTTGVSIEGIGFAIPMDDVTGMIEDLQKYGYVTGAYLGVMVMDVDSSAQYYGVPAGAYVESVTEGGAAQRGGIQKQDIITEVGGYSVTSVSDLTRVLRKFAAGDVVSVQVYRNGQTKTLSVTLDEKPREETQQIQEQTQEQPQQQMPDGNSFQDWYEYFQDYFG